MKNPEIIIYTDGACFPNPGKGGWAAIMISPEHNYRAEFSGSIEQTTNNRMELMAAIQGLERIKKSSKVRVVSDSKYLINGFNKGWSQAKNSDLWAILQEYVRRHEIEWVWMKSGEEEENKRADELANAQCGLTDDNRPKHWKSKR